MKRAINTLQIILLTLLTIMLSVNCANRGSGPQGGPRDTTPPRLTKTNPINRTTNITPKKIELTFDEIVVLKNAFEKIVVSPPQSKPATTKALGHKIEVTLNDSLIDNTTYSIDFADAIVDNNEGNKFENYSYCFATGATIDTLQIAGKVIDASTLNPVAGIIVGIHSNHQDSAFTKTKFDRITRTNSKGEFIVNNIKAGSYKIYALQDMGNNFRFDIPTERIAFLDSIYTPTSWSETHIDTTWTTSPTDSTTQEIDTIIEHTTTHYLPDSVLLISFEETNIKHYLSKHERPSRNRINLIFGAMCDTLPILEPLDSTQIIESQLQINETRDTLTYWLTDTLDLKIDTIRLKTTYQKHFGDTLRWQTDTLSYIYRAPKKPQNINPADMLMKDNSSMKFDIYAPLEYTFSEPVKIDPEKQWKLEEAKDTTWHKVNGAKLEKCDSIGLHYHINFAWKESTTYRVILDSALFTSITGVSNNEKTSSLTIKSLEEYSTLIIKLSNYNGSELIQIIDKYEKVIRQGAIDSIGQCTFKYMKPDTYYARLIQDRNGNSKWDSGKYSEQLQPETVNYFPYSIELRAYWDVEEEWDLNETPLLEQKPKELIPKEVNK